MAEQPISLPSGANPDELLTVREAQTLLKLSLPTIYKMLKRGDLQGLRIGSRWRIRRRAILQLLEDGKQEAK